MLLKINQEFYIQKKLSLIKRNDKIKLFWILKKLRDFNTSEPALPDMFKEVLNAEEKWYLMEPGSNKRTKICNT